MIQNGDIIKHERNVDVAFEVDYVSDLGLEIRVSGYWITIGYDGTHWRCSNGPRGTALYTRFDIRAADLNKWLHVVYPQTDQDLRKTEWQRYPRRVA